MCLFALPEEQSTAAHEDRVNREPELIEQAMLQQRLTERTMAIHDKVLAVLLLELGHLGRDIAPDDCRVIPISPFQGGREDILADVVTPVGVVAGSSGPTPGEAIFRQ